MYRPAVPACPAGLASGEQVLGCRAQAGRAAAKPLPSPPAPHPTPLLRAGDPGARGRDSAQAGGQALVPQQERRALTADPAVLLPPRRRRGRAGRGKVMPRCCHCPPATAAFVRVGRCGLTPCCAMRPVTEIGPKRKSREASVTFFRKSKFFRTGCLSSVLGFKARTRFSFVSEGRNTWSVLPSLRHCDPRAAARRWTPQGSWTLSGHPHTCQVWPGAERTHALGLGF